MSDLPTYLITNDDGIDSPFLRIWVEVLISQAQVVVVAPLKDQSGVGRKVTTRREVHLKPYDALPCPAWTLDGTPTDCVNIALSHLLPKPPQAVLSGINISSNVGFPILLSSGTFAGASEGALWNLPSWAVSFQLSSAIYHALRDLKTPHNPRLLDPLLPIVRIAAERTLPLISESTRSPNNTAIVHNLNFPSTLSHDTPITQVPPIRLTHRSFFKPTGTPHVYRFSNPKDPHSAELCDASALARGEIALSQIKVGEC